MSIFKIINDPEDRINLIKYLRMMKSTDKDSSKLGFDLWIKYLKENKYSKISVNYKDTYVTNIGYWLNEALTFDLDILEKDLVFVGTEL